MGRHLVPAAIMMIIFVFVSALGSPAQEGACEQLGVNCRIERHHDDCDEACRQQRREDRAAEDRQYREERDAYLQRKREQQEADREARARQKEVERENKNIEKANKLAADAWEYQKKSQIAGEEQQCKKAVELYTKALALTDFSPWSQNKASCEWTLGEWKEAYGDFRTALDDKTTSAENIKRIKWAMWSIQYERGRRCPEPPIFNGTHDGCIGRTDMNHLDQNYVPIPPIEGRDYELRNLHKSSGHDLDFILPNGVKSSWNMTDMHMVRILDGVKIESGEHNAARFTLPDGHDFVIGPKSSARFVNFIYDPNTSTTETMLENFTGIVRFVTGKLKNLLAPQTLKIRCDRCGLWTVRGTDVEFLQDGSDLRVYVYDGEVEVSNPEGDWIVTKGHQLVVSNYGDGFAWADLPFTTESKSAMTHVTDNWDMTPTEGRQLQ